MKDNKNKTEHINIKIIRSTTYEDDHLKDLGQSPTFETDYAENRRSEELQTETPSTIGSNIKRLRRNKGLTLKTLARKIGLTSSTLCNYEKDKTEVKALMFIKLAHHLNVHISELFKGCNNINLTTNKNI
jgi:DNA-binding XRE family transcriptional regulator